MSIAVIFNALVAIPKIASLVESFASGIVNWWVQRQTNETLGLIADAVALQSNAKTDADRAAASKAWYVATNRPRYTS
jgi:hypothetical protein